MKIVHSSHPLLRKPAEQVAPEEIDGVIAEHKKALGLMFQNKGCGLAAPQLGVSKRWFVWTYGLVINPDILERSEVVGVALEGCLSFPGAVPMPVSRPVRIKVRYMDENKRFQEKELVGRPARIFQHEFDHLSGVVIY